MARRPSAAGEIAWVRSLRTLMCSAAAVCTLVAVPGAITTFFAPGAANADVCANVGRRVSVSGCANVADTVAPYVPPPAYYAPLPEDPPPPGSNVCVGYNGRWVSANNCN